MELKQRKFGRPYGKLWWIKYVVLAVFSALLLAALSTNLYWASSYRSLLTSFSSRSSRNVTTTTRILRQRHKPHVVDLKIALPGEENVPFLEWEKMATAPVNRLDGYAAQIGNLFYVFAGYQTIDMVHSHVDVYNLSDNTWCDRIEMPKDMANSHLGLITDGRYIYCISGQYGPQCRGPTSKSFVLDTQTKTWSDLPPLPHPRYAPATQIWRGRLHVMGGSKEDRWTPAVEHWSLSISDGKALESSWRSEIPIPRGGPHRACVLFEDRLYVIGGQEGDFKPKPGSPIFKCSRQKEVIYNDVYMLYGEEGKEKWKQLPGMPRADSHIECAYVIVNDTLVVVGGTTEKDPVTNRMVLVGEIFTFDFRSLKWQTLGRMPYRVKTTLVALWDGWLYFNSGQRDRGPLDPYPKNVIGETWRTKLHLL